MYKNKLIRAQAFLKQNVFDGAHVVAGVSGGADSVSLLHFLASMRSLYNFTLTAVHVNHNIRGEEALRDESFVKNLCSLLDVPLNVFSVDVPSLAKQTGIGEEECGRNVRYECFAKVNPDKIAVAHTASDNAETLIFNIVRGTGLKGASGIPQVRDNIIRPFIEMTRDDIEQYIVDNNLSYIQDSTNSSLEYTRNKIRNVVMPVLTQINSQAVENMFRFSALVSKENEYLDKLAENALAESFNGEHYVISKMLKNDDVILNRMVHKFLSENLHKDISQKYVELFISALRTKSRLQLEQNYCFYFDNDVIRTQAVQPKSDSPWKVKANIGKNITPFGSFVLRVIPITEFDSAHWNNALDFDSVTLEDLYFCSGISADKFTDSARKVTKTIKKLFTEMKIPAYKRNTIPVLYFADKPVWICKVRADKEYCVSPETKQILLIEENECE